MVQQILRVTRDTVLKLRPDLSSELSPEEVYSVKAGTTYEIQSYAYADVRGDFDGHIKFALKNQSIRGLNTWFIYSAYAQVEFNGEVVYPIEDQENLPILKITTNTVVKRRPVQSSSLSANEQYNVVKGKSYELHSYAYADSQGDFSSHIRFALLNQADYINGLSTWYVYEQHAHVEFDGEIVYPTPTPAPTPAPAPKPTPTYKGKAFKLPGNVSTFYTDQPIIPGGSFTWGEATKNATRIPPNTTIVRNIIALARELEKFRAKIGRPFRVNSWYRPPAINRAVGGVSNSQHLSGKAVDLQVSGYSGRRLANAVILSWPGGVGIYSNLPNVIHLDIGPRRTWGF
jgi:Peptidase M15